MATYREIHGRSIQAVTTDPTVSVAEGQIWYNTTTDKFKSVVALEAWSSASPMINSRNNPAGQGGTQNASWICGGNPPAGTATEEFDGTGWSSSGNLNNGRLYGNGAGTQTAAITIAGDHPTSPPNNGGTVVEEYDGSAWTAGTAIPEGRYGHATCGAVKTAVIAIAGDQNPPQLSTTKEWNGSSWSEGGAYPTSIFLFNGTGTSTAGLCATGSTPSQVNTVAKYDGSSWTTTTNYPSTNQRVGMAGAQTSALCFGGSTSPTNTSFKFDGTTFTATPNMATSGAAFGLNGSSPQTTTLSSFGPGTTEEFNQSANVITAAAWSSSGSVPVSIRGGGSGGTKDGAWMSGGLKNSPSTDRNDTYLYDGSSWTAGNDLPNNYFIGGGTGPQTAGLLWNGIVSGGGPATSTYEFDGTNWTSGGSFPAIGPNGSQGATGAGVGQTAAVAMGGVGDPPPAQSSRMIAYDGSSWSADESMPTGVSGCAADGPNTAIWIAGGYTNPDTTSTSSQEYDGSSWTATGSLVNPAPQGLQFQGWGPQTSAIIAGGSSDSTTNHNCQQYNGTIWATAASLGTGRNNHAFCSKTAGTQAGFVAGGYEDSGNTNATEEFTAESTSINVKTLTQS